MDSRMLGVCKMIKRYFEKYGIKFHLNDFRRNEFDARYTLLYFNEAM